MNWQYATSAGEVRLFEYDLDIGKPIKNNINELQQLNFQRNIRGLKRFTYSRASNPWMQLIEMSVVEFPGLVKREENKLCLDLNFLKTQNLPLLRISQQEDAISSVTDFVSLITYFVRAVLQIHLFSFRKPDDVEFSPANRLPRPISGLPVPEIHWIAVQGTRVPSRRSKFYSSGSVSIRLTRYPNTSSDKPPLVMLHGYSASGTTFTHHSIQPNAASYFWQKGRDVWVLDHRASCGMDTARHSWTFEEIALNDIPIGLQFVRNQTDKNVDVLAHCMGAAMFSMAILSAKRPIQEICGSDSLDTQFSSRALAELPSIVHKVILSQVSAVTSFTPANTFRAYMLSYLTSALGEIDYSFNPKSKGPLQTVIDRILYTVPYSRDEFKIENPAWPPNSKTGYTRIRHRMDALYGRVFSLKNVPDRVLQHMDDLFGPMNFSTLTQVIHFAKHRVITNSVGRNVFVSSHSIRENWNFDTLAIHGSENGLSDVSSINRLSDVFGDAGVHISTRIFEGFGHQDSLIGKDSELVFEEIEEFLSQLHSETFSLPKPELKIAVPAYGPVVGVPQRTGDRFRVPIQVGISEQICQARHLVILPVLCSDQGFLDPDGEPYERSTIEQRLLVYPADAGQHDNWQPLEVDLEFKNATGSMLVLYVYGVTDEVEWEEFPRQIAALLGEQLDAKELNLNDGLVRFTMNRERDSQLCLAFGSCQYPPGILDRHLAYRSYHRLSERLDTDGRDIEDRTSDLMPEFLLLLGDQIYADATAGLFDPVKTFDKYERNYLDWLEQPPVRQVLSRLPSYQMPDDHEFVDNWEPVCDGSSHLAQNREELSEGIQAYIKFQRHLHQMPPQDEEGRYQLWMDFEYRGFQFFMADSRTDRLFRNAENMFEARMMSEVQKQALFDWLLLHKDGGRPLFVSSSSILLPRRSEVLDSSPLRSDGWSGYPGSLHELLAFVVDQQIPNLVFLSGDEHLANLVRAEISHGGQTSVIHSIHTSALYAPMPFANTRPDQLLADEAFEFGINNETSGYRCQVNTRFLAPGDGFTFVGVTQEHQGGDGRWLMRCESDREEGSELVEYFLDGEDEFPG